MATVYQLANNNFSSKINNILKISSTNFLNQGRLLPQRNYGNLPSTSQVSKNSTNKICSIMCNIIIAYSIPGYGLKGNCVSVFCVN